MTIKTLLESRESLAQLQNKELPVVPSFKIGRLIKQVVEALNTYDEARTKRIKELGEEVKDEKGKLTGQFRVKKTNSKQWEKDHTQLIEQEVKIDVPEIKSSELGDVKLSAFIFANLDWLFRE